jgi:hypothetical protein
MAKKGQPSVPHPLYVSFRTTVSAARLKKYGPLAGEDEIDALARYAWNLALSEALYPAISLVEIAVRNRVNVVLAKKFQITKWSQCVDILNWLDADPSVLDEKEQPWIVDAKKKLRQENSRRKFDDRELTPGRLVAALSFGFWTALFDARYDENGSAPFQLWPSLAAEMFPGMPRTLRTRSNMSRYLNQIRDLRNRISHHEPIWGTGPDGLTLRQRYDDLMKFLRWVDAPCWELARRLDRFIPLHDAGHRPFRTHFEEIAVVTGLVHAPETESSSGSDNPKKEGAGG